MPQIAEIREIDGEIWCRVGKPSEFPGGIMLWTPEERDAAVTVMVGIEREICAQVADRYNYDAGQAPHIAIAAAIRARSDETP